MKSRKDALDRVKQTGVIPAIRSSNPIEAIHAVEAIKAGGIAIVEVSLAVPNALAVLSAVAKEHQKSVLVGAGSVLNSQDAKESVQAGACFIVTPGFDAQAVATAHELNIAIFVGALTPSEVQMAYASGADAVKLFPCYAIGGPRYIRSLRGQFPNVDLIASGGVGLDNCSEYFRAGACAIGVGGELADAETMSAGVHRVLTVRARRLREAVADFVVPRTETESLNLGEGR